MTHSRPQRPRSFWSVQESLPLARSNKEVTDFLSLCARSESSLTNLICSGLNVLCLHSISESESHWTYPEIMILGADQKECSL